MSDNWTTIDDDTGLSWREYHFAKNGKATTLVVRGDDGLIVVSPGCEMDAAALDAIAERGPVRALIANNSWHHFGQRTWRERFPDAVSYAPAEVIADLQKKVPDVAWQPLSSLSLPKHVHWTPTPGIAVGEAVLTIETKRGPVLFAGDLLANMKLPPPPMKWLMSLTKSAPGLRLFKMATMFTVKDARGVREAMLAAIDALPPAVVVPGHGRPYDSDDVAERVRSELLRL